MGGASRTVATGSVVALAGGAGDSVGMADAAGVAVAPALQANVNTANSAGIQSVLNMLQFPLYHRSAYDYTLKSLEQS